MIYIDDINRLCRNLRERQDALRKELLDLPDGELYIFSDRNGACRYYNRLRKVGNRKKERRYGIKKDPELLNALVRKKYVTEALARLEKDIAEADRMLAEYVPADENSVMEEFVGRYPELAEGIYSRRNDRKWAELAGARSDFHEESLTSVAADGTPRRSRGELLIGAKLDRHGIPYVYEALAHPDLPYRPDFMIERPKDGKIIFWEHIGKVNDADYMEGCRRKFAAYEDVGIVPWDNLIITYDQANGGVNERLIDAMVQGWLL